MEKRNRTEKKLDKIRDLVLQIQEATKLLVKFSNDANSGVRFDAIEAFCKLNPLESKACFLQALSDPNELVRVSALEGLGGLHEKIPHDKIAKLLSDKSTLVRGTAAICLAEVGAIETEFLIKKNIEKAEDEEKAAYFFSLCKFGKIEYFLPFINFLFHDFYRIRCAVANLLPELVSESNASYILNFLMVQSKREPTKAAKSSIVNSIRIIKKRWKI